VQSGLPKGDSPFPRGALFAVAAVVQVALWKESYCAVSDDEGANWTQPVQLQSMGAAFR
jgi:hypothetical protein